MDYKTFTKKFPSDAFLKEWAISEEEYKERFIRTFNKNGFLAVGMSDVGLIKLIEAGAVVEKRGKMRIVPEKLDISERYNREVRESMHEILTICVSFVHRMQDGKCSLTPLVIDRDGSISMGEEYIPAEEISTVTQMPPTTLLALIADMRDVLAEEVFVWEKIGTFKVIDSTIVCVPNPESNIERLEPLGRPRARKLTIKLEDPTV